MTYKTAQVSKGRDEMSLVLGGIPPTEDQVKRLYTNDNGCACCTRWSEYADPLLEAEKLKQKLAGYNIIHRLRKHSNDHGQSGQNYTTHSVILRGEELMEVVRTVFDGYFGLELDESEITFTVPFKPIVHRWSQLERFAAATNVEPEKANLAQRLIGLFHPLVEQYLATLTDAKNLGTMPLKLLWTLFGPGDIVTQVKEGVHSAYKITSFKFVDIKSLYDDPNYWFLSYESVEWNGNNTGYQSGAVKIYEKKGEANIDIPTLPVLPLSWRENPTELSKNLIARGRKFENLRGYHFMMCSGKKIAKKGLPMPAFGRVVIDAFAYYNCQRLLPPTLRGFNESLKVDLQDDDQETHEDTNSEEDPEFPPPMPRLHMRTRRPPMLPLMPMTPPLPPLPLPEDSFLKGVNDASNNEPHELLSARDRVEDIKPMSDEQCLLASPLVKGFDMKDKYWCEFFVNDLSDIEWNEQLFNKLVLPEGEKELARAFVEHKNATKVDVDFVAGKGRGLVVLMFGPPGVGKTFTAEAVAEKCKLPLYSMCAGDLGTRAHKVESGIDAAFARCTLWNAILLLDEADVFLGARTNDNLDRNELVSIFLRRMEQYEGILFLTTNRARSVDPAFQSRIDLILPYMDLTTEARAEIWNNFIAHAGADKFEVSHEEILRLAELKLNGREIKNLLKSGQYLMMKEESKKVTIKHLERLAMMRMSAQEVLAEI